MLKNVTVFAMSVLALSSPSAFAQSGHPTMATERLGSLSPLRNVDNALNALTDLSIDNETADLDRILGRYAVDDLRVELKAVRSVLDRGDSSDREMERAFVRFEDVYVGVVREFNRNASRYCYDRSFAERIGDGIDTVGDEMYRASRAVRVDVSLPRPITMSHACEPDTDGR